MRCRRCGAWIRDEARFCDACGAIVQESDPLPSVPNGDDGALRAVVRELGPPPPPPPPEPGARRTETSGLVGGVIAIILGLVLLFIGLSSDWSCSVIRAFGGECYTLFGYYYIEPAYRVVPTVLDAMGVLVLLGGAAMPVTRARS